MDKKVEDQMILDAQLKYANALRAQGLYAQAEPVLLGIIHHYPDFSAAYNHLGSLYFLQGKWQDAANAFRQAIRKQADYVDAYYNLGLALKKLKQMQEAKQINELLLELSPRHQGAHFQLGCFCMQEQRFAVALEYFLLIVEDDPAHFESQVNIAHCYLRLGRLNEAISHYLIAQRLHTDDTQVLFNLGVIYFLLAQEQNATDFYLQALQGNPNFFEAHYNLGIIFYKQKKTQEALPHFYHALRLQPGNQTVQHLIHILSKDEKIKESPSEYIRSLFDAYAPHYEAHLLQVLNYILPQHIYSSIKLLKDDEYQTWNILDLGCGTGLCGALLKAPGNSLTGIDLSVKMLEIAGKKNIYTELIHLDILSYLEQANTKYDLAIAGDVLGYLGDLTKFFLLLDKVIQTHGFLVFNAEICKQQDYVLTMTGRFSYSKDYLDQLIAKHQWQILKYEQIHLRQQEQQMVPAHFYVLQKM